MYILVFRIAYAVWLLNQISQRHPGEVKILLMYDIACTLVRHLKICYCYAQGLNNNIFIYNICIEQGSREQTSTYEVCNSCIPCLCSYSILSGDIFVRVQTVAYSKMNMQILYSPQQCEGFGLSDGEVMERLWSYLRRFNRMTKEMRPAHRLDILSHALLYYGLKRKQSLGVRIYMYVWSK